MTKKNKTKQKKISHKDNIINAFKSNLTASNNNKEFEKEIEIRRLKNEINDLKSKIENLNDEVRLLVLLFCAKN